MAHEPDQREQRHSTRRVMLWAVIVGALLFVAVVLWPFLPGDGLPQDDAVSQGSGQSTQGSARP